MKNLEARGIVDVLNRRVIIEKIPILGICLGIQLFTKCSQEGRLNGLGWVDAETIKFDFNNKGNTNKIHHMGWNYINIKKQSPLFMDMYDNPRFYFVHSYFVKCNNKEDVLTTTSYGDDFVSSILHENIMGTQFHPEKSHKYGLKLYPTQEELQELWNN
jgi:glutamine amidotransferase